MALTQPLRPRSALWLLPQQYPGAHHKTLTRVRQGLLALHLITFGRECLTCDAQVSAYSSRRREEQDPVALFT